MPSTLRKSLVLLLILSSAISTQLLAKEATAVFAGGCFWCMEKPFDHLDGVTSTISGYAGGSIKNPTYKAVSAGTTGHIEVVQVTYDPDKVNYQTLLRTFWVNIDPLDGNGQFCDKGSQYRSAIFVGNDEEREQAEKTIQQLQETLFPSQSIATDIIAASTFYPAESYHQDFYQKNPLRYRYYRYGCGRDKRLDDLWKGKILPF